MSNPSKGEWHGEENTGEEDVEMVSYVGVDGVSDAVEEEVNCLNGNEDQDDEEEDPACLCCGTVFGDAESGIVVGGGAKDRAEEYTEDS